MLTLYLLRHAKSDHSHGDTDEERVLNERGRRDAANLGRFLANMDFRPDRVLCSTSKRTRETLAVVSQGAGWSTIPVDFDRDLYLTRAETVIRVLKTLKRSDAVVLLVGHEPTMESLASGLIGGGRIRFATGTLARIDLNVEDWQHIRPGSGILVSHLPPNQVPGKG